MSDTIVEITNSKPKPKRVYRPKKKMIPKKLPSSIKSIPVTSIEEVKSVNKEISRLRQNQSKLEKEIRTKMTGLEPKYVKYLLSCIDPDNHQSKIPDSQNTSSALYKSLQVIPISVNYDTNPQGNFAICVQPKVGSINPSVDSFQIMISKPGITDINDTSQYRFHSDPLAPVFYSGLAGEYAVCYGSLASTSPVGPAWYTGSTTDYNIEDNGTNIKQIAMSVPSAFYTTIDGYQVGWSATGSGTTGNLRLFTGLSGWYLVSFYSYSTGSTLDTTQKTFATIVKNVKSNGSCDVLFTEAANVAPYYDNTQVYLYTQDSYCSNVYNANQGILTRLNVYVNFSPNDTYSINAGYISPTNQVYNQVTFTKVNTPPNAPEAGYKLIPTLRPVAQSTLLTNISPVLYQSGVLGGMSAIKGETQFFTQTTENSLRTISGMSAVNADISHRCRSDMRAATGCYVPWTPLQDVDFLNFKDVSVANSYDYGSQIICGQVTTTSSAPGGTATIFYLRVVTLFEYTTPLRLIPTKNYSGQTDKAQSAVGMIFGTHNIILENPKHLQTIKNYLSKITGPLNSFMGIVNRNGSDIMNLGKKLVNDPGSAELFDLIGGLF